MQEADLKNASLLSEIGQKQLGDMLSKWSETSMVFSLGMMILIIFACAAMLLTRKKKILCRIVPGYFNLGNVDADSGFITNLPVSFLSDTAAAGYDWEDEYRSSRKNNLNLL